jgi:glycosyltransferase involved in cell wall biosynthesis
MSSNLCASIVVPVRNRPDLLQRTLETLVTQDLPPSEYEVVVCDDGSTDNIQSLVVRFSSCPVQVRLEKQPCLGPAAARNLGIRTSSAPLLLFIDSDVVVDEAAVRKLIEAMNSHPHWQGAEAALFPEGDNSGVLWDAPISQFGGRYHTAAIAYRREALLAVGGFDQHFSLPACEDIEIAIRILARGPIGFVPEAIVRHPRRRVTLSTHWRWRRHWRFETILALRYGVLAFPGEPCGPLPRFRVALSALVTLPGGRLLTALKSIGQTPKDALFASFLALFDVICGLTALPEILFLPLPERRNYLGSVSGRTGDDVTA